MTRAQVQTGRVRRQAKKTVRPKAKRPKVRRHRTTGERMETYERDVLKASRRAGERRATRPKVARAAKQGRQQDRPIGR